MLDREGSGATRSLEKAFVGRDAEIAVLRSALDEVSADQARAVFVGGEPGIGKTTLAHILAADARRRGLHVLWGRCREDDVTPPYWPWIDLLRGGAAELAGDSLAA